MTRDGVIASVAEALNTAPENIDANEPLTDQGLDSLRMINLLEQWRAEGADVDFFALSADPTLTGWIRLLADPGEDSSISE